VSQKYCQFYIYGKITVKSSSIQLTEFLNKTSMKIMQSYLYRWCH